MDLGGEPGCRLKGKDRARGLAVDKRRSACFINKSLQIFDLALDGIWRRVFTIASAPAIVRNTVKLGARAAPVAPMPIDRLKRRRPGSAPVHRPIDRRQCESRLSKSLYFRPRAPPAPTLGSRVRQWK